MEYESHSTDGWFLILEGWMEYDTDYYTFTSILWMSSVQLIDNMVLEKIFDLLFEMFHFDFSLRLI